MALRNPSSAKHCAGAATRVILSSKTGLRLGEGANDAGTSRLRLLKAVDASLKRLGTDYLDLLQLHASTR